MWAASNGPEGLVMEFLRVCERGQITIPKTKRETLGLDEGAMLLAYVEDGRLILEPVNQPSSNLLSIIRLLPSRGVVDAKAVSREAHRKRSERWRPWRGY